MPTLACTKDNVIITMLLKHRLTSLKLKLLLALLFVLIRINSSSVKLRERSPQVSIMSIKRLVMLSMVLLVYLMSLLQLVLSVEIPMAVCRVDLLKRLVLLLNNITNLLKNKLCYLLINLY